MSDPHNPKIIVALDFPVAEAALALTARLDPALCRVKVGKELFTAAGPQLVEKLMAKGFEVFLDLKFHDIPNTVANACKAAAGLGVWMVNVHALGGRKMLSAAREAIPAKKTKLIAVTLLTSMGRDDLADIGLNGTPEDAVLRLAVERALLFTGASGATVEWPEDGAAVARASAGTGVRPAGSRLSLPGSLSGLAMQTGEALSSCDTDSDPRVDRASCQTVGARSIMVAPIRSAKQMVGILKVLSEQPFAFGARDQPAEHFGVDGAIVEGRTMRAARLYRRQVGIDVARPGIARRARAVSLAAPIVTLALRTYVRHFRKSVVRPRCRQRHPHHYPQPTQ